MTRMITDDQIQEGFEEAFKILETVGVHFWTEKSREILRKGGAKIEGERVFINRKMYDAAMKVTPRYTYSDKFPEAPIGVGPAFGNVPIIYDDLTGKFRRGTIDDLIKVHKIAQMDPRVSISDLAIIDPLGLNPDNILMSNVAVMLKYTNKYFSNGFRATYGNTPDKNLYGNLQNVIQLVKRYHGLAADSKKVIMDQGICPMAPLSYDIEALENLDAALAEGLPVSICPCTIANLTGPSSHVGVAIHDLAMCIIGTVYCQLRRPGTEVWWIGCSLVLDLRTLKPAGFPEGMLEKIYVYECSKSEGIPSCVAGIAPDTGYSDYQAGAEMVYAILMGFCLTESYTATIRPGKCGNSSCGNFRKIFYDEDIVGYINRGFKGITPVLPDDFYNELAEGVKNNIFIMQKTPKNYRKEHFLPKTFNRYCVSPDLAPEKIDIATRADIELKKRIEEYKPIELTKEQKKLLQPYLPESEKFTDI